MIRVYYHRACSDGYTGAWAAWKRFGYNASYKGVGYDDDFGEILASVQPEDLVYIIDFCFPFDTMQKYLGDIKKVVILDHHGTRENDITQAKDLLGFMDSVYDINRSGAMIAYNYFHPGKEPPDMVKYVQDRDLWKFSLPNSREYGAALYSYPMTFESYDKLSLYPTQFLIDEGIALKRYEEQLIDRINNNTQWRIIAGYKVPVINTPVLFSDAAHKLLDLYPDAPFSAYYFDREEDGVAYQRWGLRGRPNGINVAKIAETWGGGGHSGASGFQMTQSCSQELFPIVQ